MRASWRFENSGSNGCPPIWQRRKGSERVKVTATNGDSQGRGPRHALYGQRLVQGSLVFSIVNALIPFDSTVVEAFYGIDKLRFLKPSFIGDTVWARSEITALKPKENGAGVATMELKGMNQRTEVILRCDFHLLIRAKRLIPSSSNPFESEEQSSS